MALLLDALKTMGYQIQAPVPVLQLRTYLPHGLAVKICPVGTAATTENTILYQDGRQIPSTLRDRFTIDEAYAREALKLHARRNGWLLHEISPTEYEVTVSSGPP